MIIILIVFGTSTTTKNGGWIHHSSFFVEDVGIHRWFSAAFQYLCKVDLQYLIANSTQKLLDLLVVRTIINMVRCI